MTHDTIGLDPLSRAYEATPVGYDSWMNPEPDQTLEEFQAVVAAAEAWQAMRQIRIVELRQKLCGGRALIDGIRFRRLR